jgi:hypothetical protein
MDDQNKITVENTIKHNSGEMSIKELVYTIREWVIYFKPKFWILILAGLLGAATGYLYAYLQKPTYNAKLTFALEDDKGSGGLGGALGLASQFGLDLGMNAGGAFSGTNLIELMKSRTLVEKTLLEPVIIKGKTTSLAEYYIELNNMREGWQDKPELKNLRFLPDAPRSAFSFYQDSVLGTMYEALTESDLSVDQKDKKVSIITIEVKSRNELFAKYFAETLVKVVSEFYIDTKSKKAKLNVAILDRQADSIRRELNAAIGGVAAANDNIYNLNPAFNIKRVPSSRRQVDVQANGAILTTLVQNLELAKVSLRKETPLIQVIDVPILPLKKEKLGRLKSMITGGLIFGFLCLAIMVVRRLFIKHIVL